MKIKTFLLDIVLMVVLGLPLVGSYTLITWILGFDFQQYYNNYSHGPGPFILMIVHVLFFIFAVYMFIVREITWQNLFFLLKKAFR